LAEPGRFPSTFQPFFMRVFGGVQKLKIKEKNDKAKITNIFKTDLIVLI